MAIVEKRPFWSDQFKRLVEKCWEYKGTCRSLHLKSALSVENGLWLFHAAPVFQEVYGGKDDGKVVWTRFEFHEAKLIRAMKVFGVVASSSYTESIPIPAITIQGEYRSHMVNLTVFLEPPPGSPVVEIIDTLKHEVRTK